MRRMGAMVSAHVLDRHGHRRGRWPQRAPNTERLSDARARQRDSVHSAAARWQLAARRPRVRLNADVGMVVDGQRSLDAVLGLLPMMHGIYISEPIDGIVYVAIRGALLRCSRQ
jgi:hypothetical protein